MPDSRKNSNQFHTPSIKRLNDHPVTTIATVLNPGIVYITLFVNKADLHVEIEHNQMKKNNDSNKEFGPLLLCAANEDQDLIASLLSFSKFLNP